MNVMTASKAQFDWAISILDIAVSGDEVDEIEFLKANALVTVVGTAAFNLADENTRLLADVEAARLVLEQERKANRRAIMELEQKVAELTDRAERLRRAISPSVEL